MHEGSRRAAVVLWHVRMALSAALLLTVLAGVIFEFDSIPIASVLCVVAMVAAFAFPPLLHPSVRRNPDVCLGGFIADAIFLAVLAGGHASLDTPWAWMPLAVYVVACTLGVTLFNYAKSYKVFWIATATLVLAVLAVLSTWPMYFVVQGIRPVTAFVVGISLSSMFVWSMAWRFVRSFD